MGAILLLSAPGNDDVTGGNYPFIRIITSTIVGITFIVCGYKMDTNK